MPHVAYTWNIWNTMNTIGMHHGLISTKNVTPHFGTFQIRWHNRKS